MSFNEGELLDLLDNPIPAAPIRKRTFFDIAGFPHRETVISNWYAYFFRNNEDHGLKNKFIESLLRLVAHKSGKFIEMNDFKVDTEVVTIMAGKRIDILITGVGPDKGKFIVIENKINYWLNNDLVEYWNHCETSNSNKVGVVLSLSKESIPDESCGNFVNVLHSELINEILSSSDCLEGLNEKIEVYFDDFCTTISNLSKNTMMDAQTNFYFINLEKIKSAIETEKAAYRFVLEQLRLGAEELNLKFTSGGDYYVYYEIPGQIESAIYYTILFDQLFQSKRTFRVVIELHIPVLPKIPLLDDKLKPELDQRLLFKPQQSPGGWLHYVGQDYPLAATEMKDLGHYVAAAIRSDLQPVMAKIISIIKANESLSSI